MESGGLLDVLTATEISPELAPLVLPGHEHLLLAYLASEDERTQMAAHRFLVRMAGKDLGTDPSVWREWIGSLRGKAER